MKQATIISAIQIFPPHSGGTKRTANIARALVKAGYAVNVYAFTGRKEGYLRRLPSEKTLVADGITQHINRSLFYAGNHLFRAVAGLPDLWHAFVAKPPHDLKLLIKNSDLVISDFPFLAKYLPQNKRTVVNSHNLESKRWRLYKSLVRKLESRAARSCDEVWATSDEEIEFYRKLKHRMSVKHLPNGVIAEDFKQSNRDAVRAELGLSACAKVILFAGSNYRPNRDAVKFLKSFYKTNRHLLQQNDIAFLILGSVTKKDLRDPNFICTGYIENAERFFSAADIGINPVLSGSGTCLKNAEYLAAGLPILSTSFGARGYDLPGDWIFQPDTLFDSLCEFVNRDQSKQIESAFSRNAQRIDITRRVSALESPI